MSVVLDIHGIGFLNPATKMRCSIVAGWGTAFFSKRPVSRNIAVSHQDILGPAVLIHVTGVIPEDQYFNEVKGYFANIAITEFGLPYRMALVEPTPKVSKKRPKKLIGKPIEAEWVEIKTEKKDPS